MESLVESSFDGDQDVIPETPPDPKVKEPRPQTKWRKQITSDSEDVSQFFLIYFYV